MCGTPAHFNKFCDGELVWSTGCTFLLVPTCEYPQPQTHDHVRFFVPNIALPSPHSHAQLALVPQLWEQCSSHKSDVSQILCVPYTSFRFRCFCSLRSLSSTWGALFRRRRDANEEYVWEQEPERTFRRDGVWEQGEPERTGFLILSPFCVFCVPLVVAGEAFLPKLFRVSQNPPCPATSSSGLLASSLCVVFVRIRGRA